MMSLSKKSILIFIVVLNISSTVQGQADPVAGQDPEAEISAEQRLQEIQYYYRDILLAEHLDGGMSIAFYHQVATNSVLNIGDPIEFPNYDDHGSATSRLYDIAEDGFTVSYIRKHFGIGGDIDPVVNEGVVKLPWSPTLLGAAYHGEVDRVKALVADGFDVNHTDPMGRTALMLAARNGQLETVSTLVKLGADLDQVDNRKRNALIVAGDCDAGIWSLLDGGADPWREGVDIWASKGIFGNARLLDRVLNEQSFDPHSPITKAGFERALRADKPEIVARFIKAGIDVNGVASRKHWEGKFDPRKPPPEEPYLQFIEHPRIVQNSKHLVEIRQLLLAAGADPAQTNGAQLDRYRSEWMPNFLKYKSLEDIQSIIAAGILAPHLTAKSSDDSEISMMEFIETRDQHRHHNVRKQYRVRQMLIDAGFSEADVDQEKIKVFRQQAFEDALEAESGYVVETLLALGVDVNGVVRGQSYLGFVLENDFYTKEQEDILISGQTLYRSSEDTESAKLRDRIVATMKSMGAVENIAAAEPVTPASGGLIVDASGTVLTSGTVTVKSGAVLASGGAVVDEAPTKSERELREDRCRL